MSTTGSLNLKGLSDYLEALAAAGRDVDEAAARALLAGAAVYQAGMQGRVAVKTGNLKRHIRIKGPLRDGNYSFVQVGVLEADENTARYAVAQEHGWSSGGRSKSGKGKPGGARGNAHPYVQPTVSKDKQKALQAMRESLEADGKL